jgi:hypothetical protein
VSSNLAGCASISMGYERPPRKSSSIFLLGPQWGRRDMSDVGNPNWRLLASVDTWLTQEQRNAPARKLGQKVVHREETPS